MLVGQARCKPALDHGGGRKRNGADEWEIEIESPTEDILASDKALRVLLRADERKARVVELRSLVGSDVAETAEVLGVSQPTVERGPRLARTFFYDLPRNRPAQRPDERSAGGGGSGESEGE